MLRNLLIFNVLIFSSAWCLPVQAAFTQNCRTESACFEPKVTWRYKNWTFTEVCYNYPYGHWKYRRCRMEAQRVFKEKCRYYRQLERDVQGDRRKTEARNYQKLFCVAFRP